MAALAAPPLVFAALVHWIILGFGAVVVVVALAFVATHRGAEGGGEFDAFGIKIKSTSAAIMIFLVAAVGVGWAAYSLAGEDAQADTVDIGKVDTIEALPPNPMWLESEDDRDALAKMGRWYATFSDDARIVVNRGAKDGIAKGDYFATIYDPEKAKDLPAGGIANLQDELTSLIKVATVYPDKSVAQLDEWAYAAHLKRLPENLAVRGKEIPMDRYAPVLKGQSVVLVPREENVARTQIEKELARAGDRKGAERRRQYREAMQDIDDFLLDYKDGFFVGNILFDKAQAQFDIGQYAAAIDTFKSYRERFPFHPSAGAARDWIERAEARLAKRD